MSFFSDLDPVQVRIIHHAGEDVETSDAANALIQSAQGFFDINAPIDPGDVVEFSGRRGGLERRSVGVIEAVGLGDPDLEHVRAGWGAAPTAREAPVTRLAFENFHIEVIRASGDLYADGHYASAILEAFKSVDLRVRRESGIDGSGRPLMLTAFSANNPLIDVRVEDGQSGNDEQEGFMYIFAGAMMGIRNPKAHQAITQTDPQKALEYLAFASLLHRRVDDARITPRQ